MPLRSGSNKEGRSLHHIKTGYEGTFDPNILSDLRGINSDKQFFFEVTSLKLYVMSNISLNQSKATILMAHSQSSAISQISYQKKKRNGI